MLNNMQRIYTAIDIRRTLTAGWKVFLSERKTLLWSAGAAVSRLAPLLSIPIMLKYSSVNEADRYALVIANATILALLLNFGQVANMQSRFSALGLHEVFAQGAGTALIVTSIAALVAYLLTGDMQTILANVGLALSLALYAQYNCALRITNAFNLAAFAELCRVVVYAMSIYLLYVGGGINFISMTLLTAVFYAIPYLAFGPKLLSWRLIRKATYIRILNDLPSLSMWTTAAVLTATAWLVIRYAVNYFGRPGDLAVYSAILGISSAGTILTDMAFVRISRRIIGASEDRRGVELRRLLVRSACVALLLFLPVCAVAVGYTFWLVPKGADYAAAPFLICGGYLARFFYVFGQNIIVGLRVPRFDMLGGIGMMLVSVVASLALVPNNAVIGGAVAFMVSAICMCCIVAVGILKNWARA